MAYYPYRIIQLRDIQGVAANGNVIINIPKGPRYKYIGLVIGNTAAGNGNAPTPGAILNQIQMVYGTGVQRTITGANLDVINTAMGAEASYGYQQIVTGGANGTGRSEVGIYLEEPWRKRGDYQNGLAWQTGWMGSNDVFQLLISLQNVTPVLTAFAVVDDFNGGKPHPIMKWFSEQSNTNGATLQLANIFQGRNSGDLVSQISCMQTSDAQNVIQARLLLNQQITFDDVTTQQNGAMLTNYGMIPNVAAGHYHIVFDHDDMFESLIQVGNTLSSSLLLTFAGASAGTFTRITQILGLPE